MRFDDPRHGTPAGAQQHWKDGSTTCGPCRLAVRRAKKARDLQHHAGRPLMVELGHEAHTVVMSTTPTILATSTGLARKSLHRYVNGGPTTQVHRSTRDLILAAKPWSPIGIQRRLQALAVDGWSTAYLEAHTSVYRTTLGRIRRRDPIVFVCNSVAAPILAAWNDLAGTIAPTSASSRETTASALKAGWHGVEAWHQIDDPTDQPIGAGDVDEVVVERILAGEWRFPSNNAERAEVVRRWRDAGRGVNQLRELTGWKPERYYDRDSEVA